MAVIIKNGDKFGRWTVVEQVHRRNAGIEYRCVCECGTEKIVYKSNLVSGRTKSCGCYQKELYKETKRKKNNYVIVKDKGIVIGTTLNTKKEFYIDLCDYPKVCDICWYEDKNGYIVHKGKTACYMHRLIMECNENGKVIDHINHNKRDNRKENLRICSYKENCYNKKVLPKGITKAKSGNNVYYRVQLCGKHHGYFKKYSDAKKLRDKIIKENYLTI